MSATAQPLSPAGRASALVKLGEDELDVLVNGGGVTGAGCALDAVTRGLKVGSVEARDYAAGTSRRSNPMTREPTRPDIATRRPSRRRPHHAKGQLRPYERR